MHALWDLSELHGRVCAEQCMFLLRVISLKMVCFQNLVVFQHLKIHFQVKKTTSVYPAITAGVSVLSYARDVHYSGCTGREIMMIYPLRLFLYYEHDYETKMSETIMMDLLAYI